MSEFRSLALQSHGVLERWRQVHGLDVHVSPRGGSSIYIRSNLSRQRDLLHPL